MPKKPIRYSEDEASPRQVTSNEFYDMCDELDPKIEEFAADEPEEVEPNLEEYAHFYMEGKVKPVGASSPADIAEQLKRLREEIGDGIGKKPTDILLERLRKLVDGYISSKLGKGPGE